MTTQCAANPADCPTTTVSDIVITASKPATAPTTPTGSTFATIVGNIVSIVNGSVIPLLYTLAFLFFVFGLARFLFSGSEENRKKGKDVMLYGLIGLVVIFVVWGLVDVLLNTLNSLAGVGSSTS